MSSTTNIKISILGYVLATLRLVVIISSLAVMVLVGVVLMTLKLVNQQTAFRLRTYWCRFAIWIMGVRIHKSGKLDLTPGTLYVGNHRSLVDPLIVFAYLNNGYVVGKIEVSGYPLVHTGASLSGVVYVDRADANSRKSTRESIFELLKKKWSVLVFPEGTISITAESKMFRKGAFEAAAASGSPVVAFALELGDPHRDFWYGEGLFHLYYRGFSKWRTEVYLHFFQPVTQTNGEELCEQVQKEVNAKMREFQNRYWTNDPYELV